MMIRVSAGKYKGHNLVTPVGGRTRPTSSKVREAIFSMLGSVEGLKVLDLFAGSGALGFEALSRGARNVTFVDSSSAAVKAINKNISRFGLAYDQVSLEHLEVRRFLLSAVGSRKYQLIFIDPPYDLDSKIIYEVFTSLNFLLASRGYVVFESSKHKHFEVPFFQLKQKVYGDTLVTIYKSNE